jgi:hypothetical protein
VIKESKESYDFMGVPRIPLIVGINAVVIQAKLPFLDAVLDDDVGLVLGIPLP